MLSSTQASLLQVRSNIIDIWDWAFWNITSNWFRPCNDCTKCDHMVGYLQGSFYTFACCFWYTLHVYRSPSCRCLELGQTSLICLTSPSSYNSMQSLHDLSHWEMLVYSLCYYSFSVFSWECWSTLLLNTSSTIPIVKIILMLTFHTVANLVQLLLTKPQLNTLSNTLTLALIWSKTWKQTLYLTQTV